MNELVFLCSALTKPVIHSAGVKGGRALAENLDTQQTSPAGNVTYTAYDDPDHSYRGFNSGTGLPTGPTEMFREDRANSYVETLTMSATPHLTNGVPDGSEAISGLQSLSREYSNAAGQVVTADDYFSLAGLAYTTAVLGSAGVNFYQTQYSYAHPGPPLRPSLLNRRPDEAPFA